MVRYALLVLFISLHSSGMAQSQLSKVISQPGWFSLGGRTTISAFSHDGAGLGTGGQFRIRFTDRVNSDWFADYISINSRDNIRSIYYHIGWSVLYYPISQTDFPKKVQPYILAGHCFDYNEKSLLNDPSVLKSRWGSAVQAGLGLHFNLSPQFDISVMSQYMIHLTKEIEARYDDNGAVFFTKHDEHGLEGHLLNTVSVNYKLFRLWKK